jgi:RNA polymerase sigma-70 factor (ECF subfamily)
MNVLVFTMGDLEANVPASALSGPTTTELVAGIYDGHQRELFTFAIRACRDHEAAEDLVHEAFIRLIVEVEAARTPRNVRAWLYRVVANLIASRSRHATVAERHLGAVATDDEDAGPEPAYLDHERQARIDVVLGELEEDARTALLMAASGFNGMEIAEAIGRSGNATRTLMCRTRLQLRHRLESNGALA